MNVDLSIQASNIGGDLATDPENKDGHEATLEALFKSLGYSENEIKTLSAETYESLEQAEKLANQNILFDQLADGDITPEQFFASFQNDPLYTEWAAEKGLAPDDPATLTAYLTASVEDGGLGLTVEGDPLADTSWVDGAIAANETKISTLSSLNEIQALELQATTNQMNILVTLISSIVKSYGDALLSVANKS